MAIPDPGSMADAMYLLNAKAVTDSGVQMILANAQSLTAHLDQLRNVTVAAVGRMQATLVQEDPMEAASAKQILTGHAGLDNSLVAAIAQILSKMAGNTPPVTP
jgi:hypothetical protein